MNRTYLTLVWLALVGCRDGGRADAVPASAPEVLDVAPIAKSSTSAAPSAAPAVEVGPPDTSAYAWHGDPSIQPLEVVDTLERRFAPPPGFTRVPVEEGSFGSWLRHIPLAAADTPVLSFDGRVLLSPGHSHLAAVTTLDIGSADLQQCADAIMRLHGEWLWSRGRADEARYPTGAGDIPWSRFKLGDTPVPEGVRFTWRRGRAPSSDHKGYRRYMDIVFSWANTVSLANKTPRATRDAVRPGDFFILPGSPGHSVLLLDIATNERGDKIALIGQSYMPAQSFQVLRPSRKEVWFALGDDGVDTPFWRPFPWDSLRRLDGDQPSRDASQSGSNSDI